MKNVVITGANRGIGLALCKTYLALGWKVFGVCRQASDELRNSGAHVIAGIDVTQPAAIGMMKQQLGETLNGGIDLLINNAGILRRENLDNLESSTITEQFLVNALAPLKVTEALLDMLAPAAKIAFITSRMGSIADNSSGGYYGYRMSKAALNAGAMSLAQDLKARGIAVAILHPGFVQTDMVGFNGDITAETAAQRLCERIGELTLETSGSFRHSNGEALPW